MNDFSVGAGPHRVVRHVVPVFDQNMHVLVDMVWCPCCPTAYRDEADMSVVIHHVPLLFRRAGVAL